MYFTILLKIADNLIRIYTLDVKKNVFFLTPFIVSFKIHAYVLQSTIADNNATKEIVIILYVLTRALKHNRQKLKL